MAEKPGMSFEQLPGSAGVMLSAFSLPMKAERSRNKERLEASLAGLCELELLKQRQESRVLSALCLGDSPFTGRPPWGALRSARCSVDAPNGNASDDYGLKVQTSLQSSHCSIKSSLEQQVAELKVNTEIKSTDPACLEDRQLSSGEFPVVKKNGSPESNCCPGIPHSLLDPERTGETETGDAWVSDPTRQTMVTDPLEKLKDIDPYPQAQKTETYILGLIQRRALTTRPSKPRTSLAHDARAVSVVRQSSLYRKDEQHSPKQVSVQDSSLPSQYLEGTTSQACYTVDQEHYISTGITEDAPPSYHHPVQHQIGLYHRPKHTSRSTSLDYPFCRAQQAHPDSSTGDPDFPHHFHNYPSSQAVPQPHQPSSHDEHLVNAEYIPAHPCRASTRAFAHHHSNPHKSSGVSRTHRSTYSPDRGHHQEQQHIAPPNQPVRSRGGLKKCRSNEDSARSSANKKPGKKACRSQSENSLQKVSERKYNTVERDGGGSGSGGRGSRGSQSRSKKQQGSSSCRRWQSTLELSQDEADQQPTQAAMQSSSSSNQRDHCLRRTRKSRLTHALYAYPHHNHHHSMEYQLERDQVQLCQPSEDDPHQGQGESESSMSEADSPDSSSLSSDSDESGGLVWPQQVPPQLCLPSPPVPPGAPLHPKAFVKIKASHALKKKILRFRTGSLKVMTTV
ncbi:dapper homolog 3-like isoform X2 [Parambassis ranga]|uniref:Dapper homolog 3-like isoform X2 n=1 Tax=Parambassis ranga TaxID=210632 RepID=A0A6P7JMP4_9TELE|nr:dapper homolog 3-like isoform X2 [Parambassis ranga]